MKKSLLSVLTISVLGTFASAQITLDQWDIAGVNTVIQQSNDTLPIETPGAGGANAIWNFDSLNNHTQDTLLFTNPNWTPYGPQLPTANIAVGFGMNSGNYAYLNNQANACYIVGQAGDFGFGPMVLALNPNDQLLSFPCTYNTSFNATSRFSIEFPFNQSPPIDSIRVNHQQVKTSICDGWGNVTTPLGTFPCLRIKEHNVTLDSIFGHTPFTGWGFLQEVLDSNDHYAWWADGIGFPLVEMDSALDGSGIISGVIWLRATPTPGGLNEMPGLANVSVYPNPANTEISFGLASVNAAEVNIFDASGNLVSSFITTSDIAKTDVSQFASGIYFYNVIDPNGAVAARGKFSIAK